MKILFIGKEGDFFSQAAAEFVKLHFTEPVIVFSKRADPFPDSLRDWEGDLIISYLAQWIIPDSLLKNARHAAINLHPGPPNYPGIGCTNFAVYNKEEEFGITCHHMLARVDSGSIIAVRRFPILPGDTVYSITQRCYTEILHLFYSIMSDLMLKGYLPESQERWTRKPYTRKQLNELCELRPGMDKDEIALRIKATTYGNKVWAQMKTGETNTTYSSHKN